MNGRLVMIIVAIILILLIAGKPLWLAAKNVFKAFASLG